MDNIIGNQISLLRKKFGLTQEDLAIKLGYSKQTISNWETGLKTPRMGAIQQISDLFNVPKSFIIDDSRVNTTLTQITETASHLEPPRQEKVLTYTKDQLHQQQKVTSLADKRKEKEKQQENSSDFVFKGSASAGTGEFLEDEINETRSFPRNMIPSDADYCLLVNGNSMEPVVMDQSYIFVKDTLDVPSGSIAVVIYNGESYIKRVWFENDRVRLQSFNKEYEDIIVKDTDEFRVAGKVLL